MISISPDIDAYGTYCRESALADYLEVQSVRGKHSMSKEELADLIRDNAWQRHTFTFTTDRPQPEDWDDDGDRLAEAIDRAEERANIVFELVTERLDILGPSYPFSLRGGRLQLASQASDEQPYLRLLAITMCHAYRLVHDPDPKRTFERILTEALRTRGFLTSNVGGHAQSSPDFLTALKAAGAECQLEPTPDLADFSQHAQDEGVDVIAHLSWSDRRPAHWVYIGQATCAKSDEWERKLKEPAMSQWKDLLGLMIKPRSLLAVPHHIPSWFLSRLIKKGEEERLVLDRIRLTRHLAEPAGEEGNFLAAISSVELEVA